MPNLTCLERIKIKDEEAGLTEPSGLMLDPGGDGLWTVSDDTARIFRLGLDGKLERKRCFEVPDTGLEGITADPSDGALYVVREESNEIIKLDQDRERVIERRRLADMDGYGAVARFFAGEEENKGLEGIAWNRDSGTLFTLKEGKPGLLIEVAADLGTILDHRVLSGDNGFRDPGTEDHKIDYSGICYDPSRGLFWIVSDKAKRVFLYDAQADRVMQSAALGYARDGEYREVEKAEGVDYDPDTNRLYVVSDAEVRLYVFDVRA